MRNKYLKERMEVLEALKRGDPIDLWWCFETREDAVRFQKAFWKWRYDGLLPPEGAELSAYLEPSRDGGWCVRIMRREFPEVDL